MTLTQGIKFNRQELSGAFGDIGTDFPLITAMILAAGLHTPSVLIVFGAMQVLTGLVYKMPMPAQPLKAMATIVISQQLAGEILTGAGLAIGLVMLALSTTGILTKAADLVPKSVVRGLQLGLGISLCMLSFRNYLPADGTQGYLLAFTSFLIIIFFIHNKKYPASLLVIGLGVVYGLAFKADMGELGKAFGLQLPIFQVPTLEHVATGFVLLALPQIPLSIGNSIIATRQVAEDLFPEKPKLSIAKIGITYSVMNLISPFVSGIPVCHGSGGMVGHHAFGGRTGGSVILYGSFYLVLGLFFSNGFENIVQVFPLPVLGTILIFEGLVLMLLLRDMVAMPKDFFIAMLVGIVAAGLSYGFFIGMVVGTVLHYAPINLGYFTRK